MQSKFDNVSEVGKALLALVDEREASDRRVLGTTAEGRQITGSSERQFADLLADGTVGSVLVGRSRRPVLATCYALVRKKIIENYPANAPQTRVHDGRALSAAGRARRKEIEVSGP
jgi:hypothetical protein